MQLVDYQSSSSITVYFKGRPNSSPFRFMVGCCILCVTEHVNYVITKLQAKNLLISQQEKELDHLAATLSAWIVIESSADLDDTTHCIFGRWAVSYQNVINYIFDRGMFIQDLYTNKLSTELQAQVT